MDLKKMGVNKNISILNLFDCVRVNTGLGFHWICNSEKKRGVYVNWWWYQWILEKSRFDWPITILFFIGGTYAFDRCESRKV